jgi:DNA-binding NarL/FixJ family response regulator
MAAPRVLIADDHDGFRAAARRLLSDAGFRVVGEAADGHEAIREAGVLRPSLVVLDVRLPDLDGFEVARRLLALPAAPAVVLVSTREAADYGRRIVDSGAVGFITKSRLSAGTLLEIVRGHTEDGT